MKPTNRRNFLKTLGATGAALAWGPRKLAGAGSETVSLDFWDMRDGPPDMYGGAAKKIVNQYNALNPKVSVEYELQDWRDWPQIFSVALGGGLGPDISTGGSYQAVQYFAQGDVLPLDDLVTDLKRAGDDKDFLPGTLERMVYNGHTVGLPWGVDVRVIYYRKDLFAKAGIKPPRTWDEIRDAAKALTSPGQYGVYFAGMHPVFVLILNNNGGLFTLDGKINMMTDRNIEAVKFMSSLVKDGSMNPASQKGTIDQSHKEFLASGAAILFNGLGLQGEFPDQMDKIGLLSPPMGPHGDQGTISWVTNLMLYKSSAHPEEAKTFLKYWSANEKPLWTEGHCGPLPVRKSIQADPYFQNDPITKKVLDEWVPVGRNAGSYAPGIFPALNALEGFGPMAALGQDLLQGKDAVDSLALAEQRLKALIAEKHW